MNNRKSLKGMSRRDMKKMCEGLKAIGTKYKITDEEKIVLNDIMYCLQIGWEQINVVEDSIIQM